MTEESQAVGWGDYLLVVDTRDFKYSNRPDLTAPPHHLLTVFKANYLLRTHA